MTDGMMIGTGRQEPCRPPRSTPAATASAGAIGTVAVLGWILCFWVLNVVALVLAMPPEDHGLGWGSGVVVGVRIAGVATAGGLLWLVVAVSRRVGVVRPMAAGACGVVLFLGVVTGLAVAEIAVGLRSQGWIEAGVTSFVGFAAAARFAHRPWMLIAFTGMGAMGFVGGLAYFAAPWYGR